jgi:hypothetical protein
MALTVAKRDRLVDAAQALLGDETILATLIASPRGQQTALAGGLAGEIGGRWTREAARSATDAGLRVRAFTLLVLTPTRLATVDRDLRGRAVGLLSAVPLSTVVGFELKRLGLGGRLTIRESGVDVKLECRVGDGRAFMAAFDRLRG